MTGMLTFNPDNRLTVDECLEHPFFEGCSEDFEDMPLSK